MDGRDPWPIEFASSSGLTVRGEGSPQRAASATIGLHAARDRRPWLLQSSRPGGQAWRTAHLRAVQTSAADSGVADDHNAASRGRAYCRSVRRQQRQDHARVQRHDDRVDQHDNHSALRGNRLDCRQPANDPRPGPFRQSCRPRLQHLVPPSNVAAANAATFGPPSRRRLATARAEVALAGDGGRRLPAGVVGRRSRG